MIDGTFDVAVDTPKLHRRGTLSLKSEGESIVGVLSAGEMEATRFEGACHDKEFTFEGAGEFPSVGRIDYVAKGSTWGNSLDVKVETSAGVITIFGTRIGASAGAEVSSHEFVMSASTGDFTGESAMYSGLYADGS